HCQHQGDKVWRRAMNNTTKTTARCARCGRALTSARALRTGYGPRCYTMVRAAAREVAAQHKAHQVAKAIELIEDGGVVPTTRTGCTCKAGINGRYACYHRIAVEIVEATYQPAAYQLIRTPIALGLAA